VAVASKCVYYKLRQNKYWDLGNRVLITKKELMQIAPKMFGQTSRVSSSHQNKEISYRRMFINEWF